MRFLLILVIFAMQGGPRAAAAEPPFHWWIADSMTKVRPLNPFPDAPLKSATLHAARNEFESFQIVLRGDDHDVADLDIEFSDLRTSQGAEISRSNMTVYFERFLNITQPSVIGGDPGLWPDPLIPRVDRYRREKRNAFPFTVRRDRNQPLWVDVFIPPSARPGNYAGSATVVQMGRAAIIIPIRVTVWTFVLPSSSTLKSSFGLNGVAVLKQHRGRYTNDGDLYDLTRIYAKAALQHRISIHGGSMVPPKVRSEGGRIQIDWHAYDAEVGPFLNGTEIPEGEPLYGAKATSVDLRMPTAFPRDDQQASYLAASVQHFEQSGWTGYFFIFGMNRHQPTTRKYWHADAPFFAVLQKYGTCSPRHTQVNWSRWFRSGLRWSIAWSGNREREIFAQNIRPSTPIRVRRSAARVFGFINPVRAMAAIRPEGHTSPAGPAI
jgi:hypothetical protein